MTNPIGARRTALIFVAAATMMFACSSDGQSPLTTAALPEAAPEEPAPEEPAPEEPAPEEPAPEEPAPEEPAPEEPAPEQPAPEQPAPEDPTDDGLTSQQWTFIILGALLVIAVIAGVAAMMSRRSKGSGVASSQQARLDGIMRNARAIHDSTVLTRAAAQRTSRAAVGLERRSASTHRSRGRGHDVRPPRSPTRRRSRSPATRRGRQRACAARSNRTSRSDSGVRSSCSRRRLQSDGAHTARRAGVRTAAGGESPLAAADERREG